MLSVLNTTTNIQQNYLDEGHKKLLRSNNASEFEHQVAIRVSQAMIIDELYNTINDVSVNKEYEGNDDNSIIAESTQNALFATTIYNNNNEFEIK